MDYQITMHRMMIKRDVQQVLHSYSNRCAKLKLPNQLGTYKAPLFVSSTSRLKPATYRSIIYLAI